MKKRCVYAWAGMMFLVAALSAHLQAAQDVSETNYARGVQYFKQESYDMAIQYLQKAMPEARNPAEQAKIYNLIGLAYFRQGDSVPSAIGSFEQAVRIDPKFAEAYYNMATAYAGNEQAPEKAAEYFQKTIEVDPGFSKAYFGLGWFNLMQKENPTLAMEYFQKTLNKYPDFAEAYYGMGLARIRLRKPHMALGDVSRLRELQRDDLAAMLEKAIIEVSPPKESVVSPGAATGAPAQPASPGAAASARSPFEVVMKGKLIPPKKAAANTEPEAKPA